MPLTLDLLGCWVCALLNIVQQSWTTASLTVFTSLIKMAASTSFLPYQCCHILMPSFWALHLAASPARIPLSCHCRQRCQFPLCGSILRNKTWVVNSEFLEHQPWLPQQLSRCCCSAPTFPSHHRTANESHILQWPRQWTELTAGQCVLCRGRYGRKNPVEVGQT